MQDSMIIQGRDITAADIDLVRDLISQHSDWGRTRLSEELCRCWDWRNAQGRVKDMAARALLLKLELRGLIGLPARRCPSTNHLRNRDMPVTAVAGELIGGSLGDLQPLSATLVEPRSDVMVLFNSLLSCFHYLGHRNTVGENLRYLVRDRQERPVATGRPSTLIPCMRWKPLWTARGLREPATKPPTGCDWARRAAERATTANTASMPPSKTCISIRLARTSERSWAHDDA